MNYYDRLPVGSSFFPSPTGLSRRTRQKKKHPDCPLSATLGGHYNPRRTFILFQPSPFKIGTKSALARTWRICVIRYFTFLGLLCYACLCRLLCMGRKGEGKIREDNEMVWRRYICCVGSQLYPARYRAVGLGLGLNFICLYDTI